MFSPKQESYLRSVFHKLSTYLIQEDIEKVDRMLKDKNVNVYYANDLIGAVMFLMKPLSFNARVDAVNKLIELIKEYDKQPA